ncbi:hypothetical protein EIP91_007655 [Steccherinum ochraceum]|uniref:Uncharacterized protein n=1 Tax=Steccherinum ochraceum TaxID=92696 RepID=A0A4R0RC75_9APHY|nr:hypothetical protein EIP91_007655 [Steccherinum ochraceum]
MANNGQPVQIQTAPPSGRLLGASSSRFPFQWAGDIYFDNIWSDAINHQDPRYRLCVATPSWGFSMLFVQRSLNPAQPANGDWTPALGNNQQASMNAQVNPNTNLLNVHALQPEGLNIPNLPPPGLAMIAHDGFVVVGTRVLWNREAHVTKNQPNSPDAFLYYHQHKPRKGPDPSAVHDQDRGKSWKFNELILGSQVQQYRRIRGPP